MKWLKKARVAIAIIFFLLITLLFIQSGNNLIPSYVRDLLTASQIAPSIIKIFTAFGFLSIILFFILLLTFLYGRVYCSTLCPLGILQDIIIHIKGWWKKKYKFKYRYKKQLYYVHYILLALTIVLVFIGSMLLLNLFEPFSNYGRLIVNLLNPLIIFVNNQLVQLIDVSGLPLYTMDLYYINIATIILTSCFFLLIIYLSIFHGRLYCNLLCPVGALLGIISRFSVYKITIKENVCTECGLCEKVCKANCIDSETKKVDFAACIGCFNCIAICSSLGVVIRRRKEKHVPTDKLSERKVDKLRRVLLRDTVASVFGIFFLGNKVSSQNQEKAIERYGYPISPPGSRSVKRFSSLCTACHLCVNSCPTQVLYPAFLDYGISGILQPKMNYSLSYCNYDCVLCSQVCPTGAILPLTSEEKRGIQIGKSVFILERCIVFKNKTDCGACSEHCPTKAVYMVPYNGLFIPELDTELCVGCGACEYVCPAEPEKAILIISELVHKKARIPQSKKLEPSLEGQDFPF